MTVTWWQWMAFGLLLVAAELFVPSFTIVWFGLGACLVGLVVLAAPGIPLAVQILAWAAASAALTVLWFRVFRPKMADRTTAGMSQEAIVGETGMILRGVGSSLEKGRIRFPIPVLGAEEWDCMSSDRLSAGDHARVTGIDGHVLRVERAVPLPEGRISR